MREVLMEIAVYMAVLMAGNINMAHINDVSLY